MQYHVDGALVDADQAVVPATDRGFLYGDAAVCDLRAFGGSLFRPAEHRDHLRRTCDRLGIDCPADVLDRCRETLAANDLADAHLRVTVSRGVDRGRLSVSPPSASALGSESSGGSAPGSEAESAAATDPGSGSRGGPTVVVAAVALPRGGLDGSPPWDDPATLQTVKVRRPDDRAIPADGETGSNLPAVLARRELYDGADEALVRGPDGSVVGGAASTLFFVTDDGLHTPGEGPVTPGVVRSMAMEFAREADVPVHESAPAPEAVRGAEEAFLTSTVWGVRPVGSVDGIDVGGGPVYELIAHQYREYVQQEHY